MNLNVPLLRRTQASEDTGFGGHSHILRFDGVFSGGHDTTVPPDYQQRVIDAYAGPKTVIRYDGGHNARLPQSIVDELRRTIVGDLAE